jgi:hypothetical protein
MTLEAWATAQAERLIGPLGDRWTHVQAVADTARGLAAVLSVEDADLLAAAALVHDVGYAPSLHRLGFHDCRRRPVPSRPGSGAAGSPGPHPQVDHHQVAAIIRATVGLRADPAEVLAQQARGLRLVPKPGDAA